MVEAGALTLGEWRLDGGTARRFTGTKRVIPVARDASVSVDIGGDQWRDGRVGRYITAIVGYQIPGQ